MILRNDYDYHKDQVRWLVVFKGLYTALYIACHQHGFCRKYDGLLYSTKYEGSAVLLVQTKLKLLRVSHGRWWSNREHKCTRTDAREGDVLFVTGNHGTYGKRGFKNWISAISCTLCAVNTVTSSKEHKSCTSFQHFWNQSCVCCYRGKLFAELVLMGWNFLVTQ